MILKIIAVITGYLVFAQSAVLWFPLTGHPPHVDAPLTFKLITLGYGIFFSLLAGWLTRLIARTANDLPDYSLAALMFLLAVLSLLFSGGSHWTQLMTLLVFAPAAFLGRRIRFGKH